MNELASVSGKLQREVETLRELNNALLVIEASALERASDFGFSSEDVSKSQKFITDFALRLLSVLKEEDRPLYLQSIIDHLKSGIKPLEDWIEDLEKIAKEINLNKKLTDDSLATLEDLLSLLDNQFAEDLQRLYAR
jgi:hypothetical protein